MKIAWRGKLSTGFRPRRDDNCAECALRNKRRQIDLDIVDIVINECPWAVVWIAEEAESFSECGLGVCRIRRSDVIDDVCLDALPRATIYEEGELEPKCRLGV
jgi:hypothetical protein